MNLPIKIKYICNARCRSVRVRIMAEGIQVIYPPCVGFAHAEAFVQTNWAKISSKLQQLQERKKAHLWLSPGSTLQTLSFTVRVVPEKGRTQMHATLKNGELTVFYPSEIDLAKVQSFFWNSINYYLRKEAKRILPDRVAQLAQQYGFHYCDVKIQSSRSRWGSCSLAKHINLSFYLLLAPSCLVDYVILHELCHTVEMNHSARFWALLNKVTDNKAKQLRNELKCIHLP